MADNAARKFAIAQLIIGFSLLCFGIGEQVTEELVSQPLYVGIVAGIWVLITGFLGINGTGEEPTEGRNCFATAFRCFSGLSAFLSGGVVGLYTVMIFIQLIINDRRPSPMAYGFDVQVFILAMIIALGGLECCIACRMTFCFRNRPRQESSGVPVAVRMEAGATFVADQTVFQEAQDNEPQIVLLPDYREMDDPPPPYEAAVSGNQTSQDDMPPPYVNARGEWVSYV